MTQNQKSVKRDERRSLVTEVKAEEQHKHCQVFKNKKNTAVNMAKGENKTKLVTVSNRPNRLIGRKHFSVTDLKLVNS